MDKMRCTASLLHTFSVNYKQDSVRCFSAGFVTVTCKQIIITLYMVILCIIVGIATKATIVRSYIHV